MKTEVFYCKSDMHVRPMRFKHFVHSYLTALIKRK